MFSLTLDRTARRRSAQRLAGLSVAAVALFAYGSALAQDTAGAAPSAAATAAAAPTADAMTNLIRLLVARGTLTQADGDALLTQAQAEAMKAAAPPPPPPVAEGAVRVSRVPEAVRAQIRDEIRGEIMAQAATEGWVTKGQAAPEWTKRVRVYGDVRVRSQSDLYSKANSNTILDFGRITDLGPIDYNTTPFLPLLNTRVDRVNRLRIRARLGVDAAITKGVTAQFMLGTGDNNSPISENASLGGGFAKREIWLDLANFKVEPTDWSRLLFGRFKNPFNSSEMLYDNDLRFDGVAAQLHFDKLMGDNSTVQLTGGAFPLDYGSPNFPDNSLVKQSYPSRWLLAGELKLKGVVADDVEVEASAGYHRFTKLQGRLSAPCNLDQTDVCSTDNLSAQFLRKGNTLFALRNLTANTAGISPQLLGLKFGYNMLDFNLGVRVPLSEDVRVGLAGSYVRNIGFRRRDLCSGEIDTGLSNLIQPVNNVTATGSVGSVCTATTPATFNGGRSAWRGEATIGTRTADKKNSWNFGLEYRYVQSDAVLDALTDSDFHLGGTNAKGYIVRGEYGIADGLVVGGRWLSSNEVSGDPFAIDVLQIDLRAQF